MYVKNTEKKESNKADGYLNKVVIVGADGTEHTLPNAFLPLFEKHRVGRSLINKGDGFEVTLKATVYVVKDESDEPDIAL